MVVEKIRLWLPVCLYCAAIFGLSGMEKLPEAAQEVPDKLGHLVVYAGLGVLAARAFSRDFGLSRTRTWLACSLFCLIYGLTDEYHQSFVPGRSPEVGDVLADLFGGLAGAYVYAMVARVGSGATMRAESQ